MNKIILLAVSSYKKNYYYNEAFIHENGLPKAVQDELRAVCSVAAEKCGGNVIVGFYENGDVYVEAAGNEDDFDYDEIGARIIIDALTEEKAELLRAVGMWYKLLYTNLQSM